MGTQPEIEGKDVAVDRKGFVKILTDYGYESSVIQVLWVGRVVGATAGDVFARARAGKDADERSGVDPAEWWTRRAK